jgi:signal transduction histidine kinase
MTREKDEVLRDTLFFIAQKGWAKTGNSYLNSLVEFLGKTLDVEYAIVDEIMPCGTRARTIGLYANGAVVHNIEYDLVNTPCENVMDKRLCIYPTGIQGLFPKDDLLVKMGVDSYMGIPLWDSKGVPIGLIEILGAKPLENVEIAKAVLQIVALRTAHEMERRRDDQELSKYYSKLEETVNERTQDLQIAIAKLANANAEIKSINEKLSIMSGITYHDIANQVLILQGTLLSIRQCQIDARARELMSRMERSIEVVSRTIDIARDYEHAGLNCPTWQEIQPMIDRLGSTKISITAGVHGLSIHADPLLQKAFFNLLHNSERHGGNADRVRVNYIQDEDGLRLIWEDNGVGIPVEKKDAIFEFDTLKNRVHGLFLIRKILNITGMSIKETGMPGNGARFEIRVPPGTYRLSSSQPGVASAALLDTPACL